LLAVAVLTLFAALILLLAAWLSSRPGALSTLGLVAALLSALPAIPSDSGELPAVVGIAALAVLAMLLLPGLELNDEQQRPEVAALLLLASSGAVVLATASDLLSLAVGLEILSLSVAVMTGLGQGERTLEAAFKYFLLASLGVASLIFGIGLFALGTGSLSLSASAPSDSRLLPLYAVGLVLIGLGFAFELALTPLHWGALGAYWAAPPGLAGFIMSASKLGAVLALSRLAALAGAPLAAVLVGLGVLSIGWGTLGALAQRDLRGLLSYSAIAHAGFLALALGCGSEGRVAAVFYAIVYAATAMLVFAALAGQGCGPLPLDALRTMSLGPVRGLGLALGLFSLAGIPPTPGFWAKLAMLGPAWAVAGPWPTTLAVVASVAGALYYLRPLPDLFAAIRASEAPEAPMARATVVLAGAALVVFGVLPYLVYQLASQAGGGLVGGAW
jgi:NADH-quinone oxidoreductase subunit N